MLKFHTRATIPHDHYQSYNSEIMEESVKSIEACLELSESFLEKVLKGKFGDSKNFRILNHAVSLGTKPGDNFASIIYTVDIDLEVKSGDHSQGFVPGIRRQRTHLLLKCYPSHASRQDRMRRMNIFYKELQIYKTWIPELKRLQTEVLRLDEDHAIKLPFAHFIHGECINFDSPEQAQKRHNGTVLAPLQNYIVMEDMRTMYGFRMPDRRKCLNIEEMGLVVKALAAIHCVSWAYRTHVEENITSKYPFLTLKMCNEDRDLWPKIVTSNLDEAIAIFNDELGIGNELSQAAERFKPKVGPVYDFFLGDLDGRELDKMLRIQSDFYNSEESWKVISHGDCWSNNLLFRYDYETGQPLEVILVDHQLVHETCVVNDLIYAIYISTDLAFRKMHMDELLQLYHDEFNRICANLRVPTLPAFSIAELRRRFKRAKLFGFLISVAELPVLLKDQEDMLDMEKAEVGKTVGDMMRDICQGSRGNQLLRRRLVEVGQELYDDGII